MRIGIDIGGTKVEAVAIDEHLNVLDHFRAPVQADPSGVVAGAIAAIEEIGRNTDEAIESVGIGVPGRVHRGVVHDARNLKISSLDLETAVADATRTSVKVANDVNAAALGAWTLSRSTSPAFAYLNLGTGMAAGLVLDGRVWEGAAGLAGEIGYVSIDTHGPSHVDGLAGTLEGYASGAGVVSRWGIPGASAADVFRSADAGDARAIRIRDDVYFGAASAVRVLALLLGADTVVLGGGLTGLGEALVDGMNAHFEAWAESSALIASLRLASIVQILDHTQPTHAIGAAIIGGRHG